MKTTIDSKLDLTFTQIVNVPKEAMGFEAGWGAALDQMLAVIQQGLPA
jgi:hypothetical protein